MFKSATKEPAAKPADPYGHDFSMQTVPDSWRDAEGDAPDADATPITKKKTLAVVPDADPPDMITGTIAALSMSFVCGAAWYAVETQRVLVTPWLAVFCGLFIGIAVRLGMGARHADVRATLSLIFYVMTIAATSYMIERFDWVQLYGSAPNLRQSETELVRDRLTEPTTVIAWLIGAVATVQIGYLLRERRWVRR